MNKPNDESLKRVDSLCYKLMHDFMQALENEQIIKPGWSLEDHETLRQRPFNTIGIALGLKELEYLGILKPGWELTFTPEPEPVDEPLLPPGTEINWEEIMTNERDPLTGDNSK